MVRAAPGFLSRGNQPGQPKSSQDPARVWGNSEDIPALASDKVATVLPVDAVRAGSAVLVVNSATVVGPERVVKPVVGAGAALGATAGNELANLGGVEGHGEDAGGAEDEGLEGNHGDVVCS